MKTTTAERGFLFSLDLLASSLAVAAIFFVSLSALNAAVQKSVAVASSFDMQKNAFLLADSLVKNRNEAIPLLGSASFDEKKHRVLSNVLDKALLEKIDASALGTDKYFAKSLSLRYNGSGEEKLFETGRQSSCLAVERFVFVENKKAVLRLVFCSE